MVNSIHTNELLARFIMYSKWIRNDQTIRPDAFIPSGNPLELSVTRHSQLTQEDIWKIGDSIASKSDRTLHGRADIITDIVIKQNLNVIPDPIPENQNHAIITNWPLEKDRRKMCALEIARKASFIDIPV